jgi:cytoskeleton protein RodZ
MIAIGETLRRERLRRNLDLQQISNELKLSTRFLEAIESEQFDRLPGGVFTRSFVRQYARFLGLDEAEMAAEVVRLVEPPAEDSPVETKTRPSVSGFPLPPKVSWDRISDGVRTRWPNWLPGLALVVTVTVACSGAYVWWERAQRAAAHTVQRTAPPPQPVVAAPGPSAEPAPPADAGSIQPPVAGQPSEPAANSAAAAPTSSAEAAGPAPASLQRVDSPAGGASAVDAGAPVHVQLTARKPVWVRAVSNGKTLFENTLAANETRTLDATGSVELRLGNAGGVDILLNGKSIGPVGPEGQIRTVQLTSGGFNIVAPSKPAPTDPL